jgi:hypothetical protein
MLSQKRDDESSPIASDAAPPEPPPKDASVLDTARWLLRRDLWPVIIYPRGLIRSNKKPSGLTTGKEPIGLDWGRMRWSEKKIRATLAKYPTAGVGIVLGPGRGPGGSWLIDIESDAEGDAADQSRLQLFGGEIVPTMGWSSTRGRHQLFIVDHARMAALLPRLCSCESRREPGVFHFPSLPDLEFRIGGYKPDGSVKQVQSVCPPTPGIDERPRGWNPL